VLSAELILLLAIVVMALVVGLKELQMAVNEELEDAATAIGSIDQTYSFGGVTSCCASHNGSFNDDNRDSCVDLSPIVSCAQVFGNESTSGNP
jgi:hypothetical protein